MVSIVGKIDLDELSELGHFGVPEMDLEKPKPSNLDKPKPSNLDKPKPSNKKEDD